MRTFKIASLALVVGGVLGFSASHILMGKPSLSVAQNTASSNEPLYWVAPMDPNYQRDKPGLSPMGMELVPVYADDVTGAQDKPGTVKIDPAVENNLGVKTALVQSERLTPNIETVGYVAFDESQLWQTNVRVAGWVEKLYINAVGEQVKQGDVLFTLYSPELVKAQEELIRAYQTQRKAMIKGATERLVTLGVDRSQIRTIVRSGKAKQTIEVKAAADGVIATLNIREGGYLSPAQAVISAGPLQQVWVDAEVFERQAHWVTEGSLASMVLDAIPGQEWQGEVDYVYPILDPKTRTLRVRLKFDNPNRALKPNMFASITLQPVSDESVLTIDKSSVIQSGGMTRVVLSEGNGKYRSTRIEVGREASDKIEVLRGLEEGEQVVVSAHFMLDSESSQTADLSRISLSDSMAQVETAWATGEITNLMAGHRMATINHQPVDKWQWPSMVMDFTFADQVDLQGLSSGQRIDFEMQKMESGPFQIINVRPSDESSHHQQSTEQQAWINGTISMLMADFGMITISHQAVEVWQWQAGEMNFSVDESVNLNHFSEGQMVRFLVEKQGAEYQLKALNVSQDIDASQGIDTSQGTDSTEALNATGEAL